MMNDLSNLAVLGYAIDNLNIIFVVIFGHSGCGGVAAAMRSVKDDVDYRKPTRTLEAGSNRSFV
ncbi:hypothetical protein SCHPADRAFT_901355 [Schizopora paradoxa]|uniref:Carbonic anhydrase n=1 Tax=Schizopora paradoxa TaxID=27342 RepID=A0A0H2S4E4_9AGAM|nr:hypothetical protein SCHPADRAFT_901355 [Schizopora paradoxa]